MKTAQILPKFAVFTVFLLIFGCGKTEYIDRIVEVEVEKEKPPTGIKYIYEGEVGSVVWRYDTNVKKDEYGRDILGVVYKGRYGDKIAYIIYQDGADKWNVAGIGPEYSSYHITRKNTAESYQNTIGFSPLGVPQFFVEDNTVYTGTWSSRIVSVFLSDGTRTYEDWYQFYTTYENKDIREVLARIEDG